VARGPDEIVDYLHGINAAMDERSRYLGKRAWKDEEGVTWRGMDYYDPYMVPEIPMLGFYLPEAQDILEGNEYVAKLVTGIAAKMRKAGIYLVFDTHYPEIGKLGGQTSLRQQIKAGNVVCYRNSEKSAGGMLLPNEWIQPHQIDLVLPNGETSEGMSVVYSSAPGSTRRTFARSVYVKRAHYWARQAAEKIPALDDLTAEAFGNKITARNAVREEAAAKTAREADERAARETGQPVRESITVASAPSPAPTALPVNGTTIERAAAYLASHPNGQATTGAIAQEINAALNAVSTALRRETNRDNPRIYQPRPGVWATTGARRQMEQVA
jgi:hypothetical protein